MIYSANFYFNFLFLSGIVKNPKESKILLKMTTPFEKYNLIKGRFGFSEKNKHFFAELIGPSSSAGLELKYFFIDSSSFNLKLHLTTPFAVLYDLTLVGFINEENVSSCFKKSCHSTKKKIQAAILYKCFVMDQ